MRFDRQALAVESRPHADIRRRAILLAFDRGFRCVDTVLRQAFLFGRKVKSRHDEFAPLAGSGFDFSPQRKRTAEQTRRVFHAAVAHGGANGSTGDDDAVLNHGRHNLDFEIPAPSEFFEQLHVARLFVTEAKIRTHEHSAGAQSVDEIRSRKIFSADFRQLLIKLEHERRIHSCMFKFGQSLLKSAKKQWSFSRSKNFRRMRKKRKSCCYELLGFLVESLFQTNPFVDCFENLLVAQMHSVEVSYRDGATDRQVAVSAIPLR